MSRTYSVDEIDRMRRALVWLLPRGPWHGNEREEAIEQQLRTHMLNGTEPGELESAADAQSR